ncbi:MAG: type ii secretion system (t2ss) protein f [Chthoniobacteraceae bacterium]|nr:type ii secretion system (t2ss) protein f [Chthoniobacteraceae bacterium]MDB6175831.1 type ii secretion system (t2ss) protein f [Chthoniobacteraceae bacterium]
MAKFEYIALDARGQESRGVLEAASANDVVGQLRQTGYFPTSVTEEGKGTAVKQSKKVQKAIKTAAAPKSKSGGPGMFARKTVSGKVLMIFTRQLATLIDAGLPLLRGLTVLAKQEKDLVLKNTINALADAVQGGSTFSESMAQHPRIFNKLYINMVKAGELGGVLEIVLQRLAEFQEKAQKIKNKVVAAMAYPVIVLMIAMLIMVFLLAFIVPRFEQIFKEMLGNKPLPGITLMVIQASNIIKGQWYYIIAGIVVFVVAYKMISRNPNGRQALDRIALKLPLFGDLSRKSSISRFSRTLGTLVTSGVPILQALNITRDTAGNAVVADAVTKVHDAVKEGESIVQPLEASGVFPPMVISMVDVGEETGQLPEMLLKIAEVYDDEVDNAVEGLTSLLEPIMIVLLALIVGTIVIALFMPLISIIQGMQAG